MDDSRWLTDDERAAWVRFAAVLELLPGVLDSQLARDDDLTHFEYFVLAMLSETPEAHPSDDSPRRPNQCDAPRLSRVVSRLEEQHFLQRTPCAEDRRATNVVLTTSGFAKVEKAAPGHVANVRAAVIDALSPEQVGKLAEISTSILRRLDPEGRMFASE